MQKSKLRWLKILELLLLVIRMLILALIALAFARPALTGKQASNHAPASIVILLDDSPSTETLSSGGTVFEEMIRGIDNVIGMLKANDEATLITMSGKVSANGPYSDFNHLRALLYSLQPQASSPQFEQGLKKAEEILSLSHNINKEVFIFSDFQSSAFQDVSNKTVDSELRYFALKYNNSDAENVALTKIEFPSQLLAPGEEFEIAASLRNSNNKAFNSRLVELYIDNEKRAQTAVDLKPNSTSAVKFNITPDVPGRHWGYFEIEDDDYNADNRFYFNFQIPQKISVLGIGETAKDVTILSNCLGNSDTGYIEFTGRQLSEFSRQNVLQYDVVIINNVKVIPPAYFNTLNDFTNSGGGLFIVLGNQSNVGSYKQFIGSNTDITVTSIDNSMNNNRSKPYYYLNNFDLTHPIFKVYSPQNPQTSEIPPLKLFSYRSLNGGTILARLENNTPVLSLASDARIMIMGFGLGLLDSDISIHSFIVPFMVRAVEHLASSPSTAEEYFTSGYPITLNIQEQHKVSSVKLSKYTRSISGISDNQSTIDKTVEIYRNTKGAYVNIPYADFPGFYSLIANTDTIGFFSVNHDSIESTIETIDSHTLNEYLGTDIEIFDGQSDIKDKIMQAKFGFELWKYCLLLALALLIAESILVRKAR
jgi:hypothetical protein